MFKVLLLLLAVTTILGFPRKPLKRSSKPLSDGRIVGGDNADIADYPYQLSLVWYGDHICGAVLISSTFAVTAAHCTEDLSTSELSIRAGTSLLTGGQLLLIAEIYQNPHFTYTTMEFDISVLELAEEPTVANVAPIELPKAGYVAPAGAAAVISGWGDLQEGGSAPDQLQAVVTEIVSNEICTQAYNYEITGRLLCAGDFQNGGKGSCQGDSGGPLVVAGKLVGLVSWSNGCARPGYPGIYTAVGNEDIRNYITEISGL